MAGQKQGSDYLAMSIVGVLFLAVFFIDHVVGDAVSWSYKSGKLAGPDKWYTIYPDCGSAMQSPINIDTSRVLYDPYLEYFDFSDFEKMDDVEMELANIGGHTAEVMFTGRPINLKGGSLPNNYTLRQFHFHWGQDNRRGSEHALNGVHYPMEVHFVHAQTVFPNMSTAMSHPYGLAAVSFFFTVGKTNTNYNQLLQYFDNITKPNEQVPIATFPITQLLPTSKRLDYFRYQGSLTTPPCYESVIWSVATDVIEISEDQLNKFRGLFDEDSKQLVDDFRPIQKINQRTVLSTSTVYRYSSKVGGTGSFILPHTTSIVLAILLLYVAVLKFTN